MSRRKIRVGMGQMLVDGGRSRLVQHKMSLEVIWARSIRNRQTAGDGSRRAAGRISESR